MTPWEIHAVKLPIAIVHTAALVNSMPCLRMALVKPLMGFRLKKDFMEVFHWMGLRLALLGSGQDPFMKAMVSGLSSLTIRLLLSSEMHWKKLFLEKILRNLRLFSGWSMP